MIHAVFVWKNSSTPELFRGLIHAFGGLLKFEFDPGIIGSVPVEWASHSSA
jgi:hypothetical protein